MLTQEQLKELLHYDPVTGVFIWIKFRGHGAWVGSTAGRVDGRGYLQIMVRGQRYQAHRLAWLYMTGAWPICVLDHIDRNRLNNSFSNLREATKAQNCANSPPFKNNRLGIRGVAKVGSRYMARIRINNKLHYLGTFDTPELASAAYEGAARVAFGKFYYAGEAA